MSQVDLVESIKFFMNHPQWQYYAKFEAELLEQLTGEAMRGNIGDPTYALKKAHTQGMLEGVKLLQSRRTQLFKGVNYGSEPRPTKARR